MTTSEHAERCNLCALIERIRAGKVPDLVAELPNGWLILGDQQKYRGYCIIFAKTHARELYELPRAEANALMDEMVRVAESIAAITHPWKMNYACLGNQEPHIHWHLHPRTADDPFKMGPVWIDPDYQKLVKLEENDRRELMTALRREIKLRIPDAILPRD